MSHTYWHRHERKPYKAPRWFHNLVVERPNRRIVNNVLTQAVRGTRDMLHDLPELPLVRRPNAHWEWH